MKKILLIITALIAVVIIAAFAFIKFYITPERVKAFVVMTAESALNRKVDIGEIDINIFEGIRLKDFAIKEADKKSDFVKCEEFVLRFKLGPLLSKQVIIDEIKLVSPEIKIRRDKKGKFNFEDIGKKEGTAEAEPGEAEAAEAESGLPISLLVDSIVFSDARFSLVDLKKELPDLKTTTDINITIKSIGTSEISTRGSIDLILDEIVMRGSEEGRIRDLKASLEYDVLVNLDTFDIQIQKADLEFQEIPASITGEIKNLNDSPELDVAVAMPRIDAAALQEMLSPFVDMKDHEMSGLLTAALTVRGMPRKIETFKIAGDISMKDLRVRRKDIDTELGGDLRFSFEPYDLNIQRAELELQGIPVSIKGSVSSLKDSAELDLTVSVPRIDIGKIQKAAAPFVKVDGLGLSGGLSADLKLKGKPDEIKTMKMNGNISLEKVGVSYEEINALLEGELKFSEKLMNLKIDTTVGRNRAELKGSVRDYFDKQDIQMNLFSKQLYIDEVIHANTSEAGNQKNAVKKKTAQKEAEPLKLKLKAKGTVRIDSAVYKGMTMSNFLMKYSFSDNKLTIPEMTANAGKGKFDIKSVLDLSKPGYRYELSGNLDSLHAEEFVNAFFPKAKDTVFGVLSAAVKLKGAGTRPESIKKNLVGSGDFNVIDGKLMNAELVNEFSGFLDISELETILLSKANGRVDIRNGVAKLESTFLSDDIEMDPKGNIGLDETLDLAFDLRLAPGLADKAMMKSNIAKYLKNEQGWGVIPMKISGTFSEPSYTVDIEKAGERVIKKEAGKFINKMLEKLGNGKESSNGTGTDQETDPVQESDPIQKTDPVEETDPLQDLIIKGLEGLF